MKKLLLIAIPAFCVASVARAQFDIEAIKAKMGEMQKSPKDTSKAGAKKTTVAEKTKGNTKHEGLFTLYQDTATGSMQMYVRKDQLGKEFIYQSFSINGPTELFLNQNMIRATMVFKMVRAFDKIEFHLVNTDFYYDKNNPVSKTANVDKPEAVFYVDKFAVEDSLGYLVSGDGLFISEKLDPVKPATLGFNPFASFTFGLGQLSSSKSKYVNVRSFPNNTDVVVDMAYDNPSAVIGASAVTDPRYVRVRMQHSFIEMPNNGFKPRKDDQRVGYFMDQVTNMTSTSPVPYKDMIHRWNLVKKDPTAALSEPVEPIVWWVENTTPLEYRQTIVEAGLKWNEAFEKAGFKNAVQMKIMPDTATWDPADIRYNVIRWVASAAPSYGAIGPSFSNPKTGQLLGADITVEWFSGSATPISDELYNGSASNVNVNSIFANNTETQEFAKLYNNHNHNNCSIAAELKAQYVTGLTALEAAGASETEIKTMHKQFLTYLIMHEMGHTMGLMHNMKASQMLSPAEVNNTEITHKIGTMASVMDYPSINVALDKTKQGDYYTTKAGPYDLWAIEYGYRQFENSYDEEMGLSKILSRSNDPQLIFGNDGDDMRAPGRGIDPRVNVNDFTNDMMTYAEDRYKLVNNLMGKLVAKYAKPNQSYAELRARYGTVNRQRSDMTNALSRYIGGIYIDRSQPEQKSGNKPMTPTPVATQKKAMELISKYIFAPNAFDADANVFPYLQRQRRGYDQGAGEDFRISSNILMLQASGALAHILNPNTLQRVTNTRLYGNTYSVADIMNDLAKGIFDADIATNVNVYRQNLQTLFVNAAAQVVEGKTPHDDISRSAARYTLKKIRAKLATAVSTNEETKAHRANLIFLIDDATTVK
ncbi:MAG: zinc-dependent metalloprotease [Chitinophagaceae bacterium]